MQKCIHCRRPRISLRSRGLCYKCYLIIEVRDLYPAPVLDRNFGNGVSSDNGYAPLPPYPTEARPGTVEKILVLQERASKHQCLWHPNDRGSDMEGTLARLGKCVAFTNILNKMDDKVLPSESDL